MPNPSSEPHGLGEYGRIAVNVETVYRTLDPAHRSPSIVELFQRMAAPARRASSMSTGWVGSRRSSWCGKIT